MTPGLWAVPSPSPPTAQRAPPELEPPEEDSLPSDGPAPPRPSPGDPVPGAEREGRVVFVTFHFNPVRDS